MSVRSRASAEHALRWCKYPQTVGLPHPTPTPALLGGLRSIGRCRSMKRHLSQARHATTKCALLTCPQATELIGVRASSTWAKQTIWSDSAHLAWLGFISDLPRAHHRPEAATCELGSFLEPQHE